MHKRESDRLLFEGELFVIEVLSNLSCSFCIFCWLRAVSKSFEMLAKKRGGVGDRLPPSVEKACGRREMPEASPSLLQAPVPSLKEIGTRESFCCVEARRRAAVSEQQSLSPFILLHSLGTFEKKIRKKEREKEKCRQALSPFGTNSSSLWLMLRVKPRKSESLFSCLHSFK